MPAHLKSNRSRQWQVLIPVGISLVSSLSGDLTLYAILPINAASLMIPLGWVGILLSANRIVRLISNPLVGIIYDRGRRRPYILVGFALGILSTVLYTNPGIYWLFLAGRLLWGISWSLIYIGAYCMMVDITSPGERGWGSGIIMVFYFSGLSLNPLLGGFLASLFGFNKTMLLSAFVSMAGLLTALLFLPETKSAPEMDHKKIRISWPIIKLPKLAFLLSWFKDNSIEITANFLYFLTLFVGEGIILSTLTLYLKHVFNGTVTFGNQVVDISLAGGFLLGIRALISALSAPLTGALSDQSRHRWSITGFALLAGSIGCLLLAGSSNPISIIAGITLTAASGSALATLIPATISNFVPPNRIGQALGILNNSGDVGSAIAPLAAYALLPFLHLESLYYVCAGLLATGILAILMISQQPQNRSYRFTD